MRQTGPSPRGRAPLAGGIAVLLGLTLVGCLSEGRPPATRSTPDEAVLSRVDSLLGELAGPPFAELSPAQRWRTLASIGRGLTPSGYTAADLPEPGSAGAAYVQAYCTQCHWLPTPRMRSADEWPILLRSMVLRIDLVARRAEGPVLERVAGERVSSAVRFRAVPDAEEVDSMRAYLVRNALPVLEPGELPPGPDLTVFRRRCSACHEMPSPHAHTAKEWPNVVWRMQENMELAGLDTMTLGEAARIRRLLRAGAAPPGR